MFWSSFPFVRYLFFLLAGITGYAWLDWFHPVLWVVLAVGALALLSVWTRPRPHRLALGSLAGVLLFVTGWTLAYQRAEKNDPAHFQYLTQPIRAYRAVVGSAVEVKTRSFRMTLQVRAVWTDSGWEPRRGRIQAYLDKNVARKPRYGDELLVVGPPEPVPGPANPGELDYRRYLAHQSIYHRQFISADRVCTIGYRPPWTVTALALRFNSHVDSVLTRTIGARREYAVINAMLLGVRDDLDPELMRAYAASGAIHVLSISGMHVGIFFVALTWAFAGYRRKIGFVNAWLQAGLILTLVWAYAILTGLSTPVVRSALMISFLTVGQAARRQHTPYNLLALAAFVTLCLDPGALFQAGFQLSYLAVLGLTYLQPRLDQLHAPETRPGRFFWQATTTALAAQLATFPLGVYYFHQFPTYFLLINPLVLVLAAAILYAGMAFPLLGWWEPTAQGLGWVLRQLAWLLNEAVFRLERLPAAVWSNLSVNALELTLLYALLVSLLAYLYRPRKAFIWAPLACAFVLTTSAVWTKRQQRAQTRLVIHSLGNQTGLSVLTGRTLTLVGDSAFRAAPTRFAFQTATFWAQSGVRRRESTDDQFPKRNTYFGEMHLIRGCSLLWLNRPVRYTRFHLLRQRVDLLLISHNAIRYPNDVLGGIAVRQVVIDGTNSRRTAERWRNAARQRGIPCHDVRETGAFVRSW